MGLLRFVAIVCLIIAVVGSIWPSTGINVAAFGWGGLLAWCASGVSDRPLPIGPRSPTA